MRFTTVRVPTWQCWIVIGALLTAILVFFLLGIHPFLSVTEPLEEGYLVVEGWLQDDAVPFVLSRYENGTYRGILTTGGKLSRGSLLREFGSFAELAAETLIRSGVPAERIWPIPALPAARDRTYASAVAVRNWLNASGDATDKLDVVSTGPHARRSRLLFEMALGPGIEVGIIALPTIQYDEESWWKTSSGFRAVTGETLAFLYAKMLFWP